MTTTLRYFRWAFLVTALGIFLSVVLGWSYTGTIMGAAGFLGIALVLCILEISLSFDNAIVNANKLKTMTPVWQRRFLTWGILIAVFGMRVIFPLLIVVVAARIGPFEAVRLAATDPDRYAEIVGGAHVSIAAFGGAFLMMVALNFFTDASKRIDWIRGVEKVLRRAGSVKGIEVAAVLSVIAIFGLLVADEKLAEFMKAAISGLLTFLLVEAVGNLLDRPEASDEVAKGGLGAFLYLEVLDASFSFDGVIGAFALTQNLFLIAIGLGVGAMYVRSMTIMLVEKQTLTEFRYLEHGAFWSILCLSVIMFSQTLWHVHEAITGLLGAGFIGLALLSSLRARRMASADT